MLLCAAAAFAAPAYASAIELNVAVASRVISFLDPRPTGQIAAVVLFDPANSASVAEAAAIERQVGNGLAVGKATLRVTRMSVRQASAIGTADVMFLTNGLKDRQDELGAIAQRNSILTITTDLSCVQAGHCAVAISSGARVQITVSRSACRAARLKFGAAFLMLVKEI